MFDTDLRTQTLEGPAIRDILHRSIDTLFVMARVTLKVTDPRTFIPAFDLLSQATFILNSIPVDDSPSSAPREERFDVANYARCISGAFYNLASVLYQGTRYGNAVPFLVESCTLGGRALSLPRSAPESMTETRHKEWTQLEEQLYRRWELLGVCYSKNSDRRVRLSPLLIGQILLVRTESLRCVQASSSYFPIFLDWAVRTNGHARH